MFTILLSNQTLTTNVVVSITNDKPRDLAYDRPCDHSLRVGNNQGTEVGDSHNSAHFLVGTLYKKVTSVLAEQRTHAIMIIG